MGIVLIQNAHECQFCIEIEEFAYALNHEDVISETGNPNDDIAKLWEAINEIKRILLKS